ncbi:F-box only protein 36-like [Ambystoma mexicanum]|uniref:F-box only protein 36-like n=1 Tax=Ambystoma mexicanum TaxID=8296 RepID=UPI0037E7BE1C
MTSLLQEKLFEMQCQAPSPSKDFHHLVITKSEVILRSWRVSVRAEHRKAPPGEVRRLHNDFLLEDMLQKQIQRIFGRSTLEYTLNLCQGHCDFLVRMPNNLIVHILSFLGTSDIKQLSETCRKFQKMCNSEEFWEKVRMPQAKRSTEGLKTGSGNAKQRSLPQITGRPSWMQRRRSTFF